MTAQQRQCFFEKLATRCRENLCAADSPNRPKLRNQGGVPGIADSPCPPSRPNCPQRLAAANAIGYFRYRCVA